MGAHSYFYCKELQRQALPWEGMLKVFLIHCLQLSQKVYPIQSKETKSSNCGLRLHSPIQPYCNKSGMLISICILCLLLHWFRRHIGKKHDYHSPNPNIHQCLRKETWKKKKKKFYWLVVYQESAVSWKSEESSFTKEGVVNHQVNWDSHFRQDEYIQERCRMSDQSWSLLKLLANEQPATIFWEGGGAGWLGGWVDKECKVRFALKGSGHQF